MTQSKGEGQICKPEKGVLGVYLKFIPLPNYQFLDSKSYLLCHLSSLADLQGVTKELTFFLSLNP